MFFEHTPTVGTKTMSSSPTWPAPNYKGETEQQQYMFNDIEEFAFILQHFGETAIDHFPENVRTRLGEMAFAAHASWHIRAIARFHGLELVEDLGSFSRQFSSDYLFWRTSRREDGSIDFNFDKQAAQIRCGVGCCPCQYRLPNRLARNLGYNNVLHKIRADKTTWESLAKLVIDGSADLRQKSKLAPRNNQYIISGATGDELLRTRVDPELSRIYCDKQFVASNTSLDEALKMLKDINSAYKSLGSKPSSGKRDAPLKEKDTSRSKSRGPQVSFKFSGKRRSPPKSERGHANSSHSKGDKDNTRRASSDGGGGGTIRLLKHSNTNEQRSAHLAAMVRKNSLANGVATTYSEVAANVPPPPTPKRRTRFVERQDSSPNGALHECTERQVPESSRVSIRHQVSRTIAGLRSAVDSVYATASPWLDNVWGKFSVLSQRIPSHSNEGILSSEDRFYDCTQAVENNEEVPPPIEFKGDRSSSNSGANEQIEQEQVQKIPVPKPRTRFINSEIVHEDGTNSNKKKRKAKGSKSNPNAKPSLSLDTGKIHKTTGAPTVPVESERSEGNRQRLKPQPKSCFTQTSHVEQQALLKSGCFRLGRPLSSRTTCTGTQVLLEVLPVQPRVAQIAVQTAIQQGRVHDWNRIYGQWIPYEWGHEHSPRQLRASSISGIACNLDNLPLKPRVGRSLNRV